MTIRLSRRALVVMAVTLAVALAVVACGLAVLSRPSDTRPVILPPTFMGLDTSVHDDVTVAQQLSDVVDGAPLAVTSYGSPRATTLNVVATRTDMTGKVDLRFLGDDGRLIGGTRCTTNVVLRGAGDDLDAPGSPFRGKVLCWRTSDRLSVSAFVLTSPPAEEDVAAALDALWLTLR